MRTAIEYGRTRTVRSSSSRLGIDKGFFRDEGSTSRCGSYSAGPEIGAEFDSALRSASAGPARTDRAGQVALLQDRRHPPPPPRSVRRGAVASNFLCPSRFGSWQDLSLEPGALSRGAAAIGHARCRLTRSIPTPIDDRSASDRAILNSRPLARRRARMSDHLGASLSRWGKSRILFNVCLGLTRWISCRGCNEHRGFHDYCWRNKKEPISWLVRVAADEANRYVRANRGPSGLISARTLFPSTRETMRKSIDRELAICIRLRSRSCGMAAAIALQRKIEP